MHSKDGKRGMEESHIQFVQSVYSSMKLRQQDIALNKVPNFFNSQCKYAISTQSKDFRPIN